MANIVLHGDIIPLWMQPTTDPSDPASICYGGADYRLLIATMFPSAGVMSLNDWILTSNNSAILNVGVGSAVVAGTTAAEQRSYLCRNATVKTIQPPGPPTSANRYDLIVLTAHDGQLIGDHLYEWQVQVISGNEAASPVVPSLPNDSIPLYAVIRRPAAINIAPADLTSLRSVALLPSQPQSQKYWRSVSSANSPAFTTVEVKDSSMPNLAFNVLNAAAIYRISAFTNVQSGRVNNLHAVYIRDGGAGAPVITSGAVAGGQSISPVIGTSGAISLLVQRELSLAAGAHTLGLFGKVIAGASAASYLTVPSGSQKYLSAEIIG